MCAGSEGGATLIRSNQPVVYKLGSLFRYNTSVFQNIGSVSTFIFNVSVSYILGQSGNTECVCVTKPFARVLAGCSAAVSPSIDIQTAWTLLRDRRNKNLHLLMFTTAHVPMYYVNHGNQYR